MGTWGHNINENDTSADVTEAFFEKYNAGMEPAAIKKSILKQFSYSIKIVHEDRDNVLFPLAMCLWEACSLDAKLLAEVRKNIERGDNIKNCRKLGADDDFLSKRSVILEKFLFKISSARKNPRRRKKPSVRKESKYRAGSCLAFKHPDNSFGGAVAIAADFFNTRGHITLALTNLRRKTRPVFADFEHAKMLDFKWESVHGQAERRAAMKKDGRFYTGRLHQHCLHYRRKQEREAFLKELDDVFCVMGELPAFTQILCATTWINSVKDAPAAFDYYHGLYNPTSEMTLKELAKVLAVPLPRPGPRIG